MKKPLKVVKVVRLNVRDSSDSNIDFDDSLYDTAAETVNQVLNLAQVNQDPWV